MVGKNTGSLNFLFNEISVHTFYIHLILVENNNYLTSMCDLNDYTRNPLSFINTRIFIFVF